jgi:hypothetical protein
VKDQRQQKMPTEQAKYSKWEMVAGIAAYLAIVILGAVIFIEWFAGGAVR